MNDNEDEEPIEIDIEEMWCELGSALIGDNTDERVGIVTAFFNGGKYVLTGTTYQFRVMASVVAVYAQVAEEATQLVNKGMPHDQVAEIVAGRVAQLFMMHNLSQMEHFHQILTKNMQDLSVQERHGLDPKIRRYRDHGPEKPQRRVN